MKTNILKNKSAVIFIAVAAMLLINSGCKKHQPDTTIVTNVDSGTYYMHLHTNVDTNEVDYGTVYTTSAGRKIAVTRAQLYLSHIQLIKTDGTFYTVPSVIVLKQQETEQYYIGKVPVGDYKSVRFYVGLDSATNTLSGTADTALNHPEMWFGVTAQPNGYIYVNFEGSIDTTSGKNGTIAQMQPFMYYIGTPAHNTLVTMPDHSPVFTVAKGQPTLTHITVDYGQLFNGVAINNSTNLMIMSKSANSSSLANTISNNIPSMFSYEE